MVSAFWDLRNRAARLGRYPIACAVFSTLDRVIGLMPGLPCNARSTGPIGMPRAPAISLILTTSRAGVLEFGPNGAATWRRLSSPNRTSLTQVDLEHLALTSTGRRDAIFSSRVRSRRSAGPPWPALSRAFHFHDGARAQRVRQFVALDDAQAKLAFGGLGSGFGDLGGRVPALIEEYAGAAAQGGGKERRGAVQRCPGAGRDGGDGGGGQALLGAAGPISGPYRRVRGRRRAGRGQRAPRRGSAVPRRAP